MPRLSHPLLPVEFAQQVTVNPIMSKFHSIVYTEEAHINRLQMRDWNQPLSPNVVIISSGIDSFTKEAGRTYAHLASYHGDVLLLSEYLRCGATADLVDSAGISPLYLALSEMAEVVSLQRGNLRRGHVPFGVRHEDGTPWREVDFKNAIAQYAWIARILVGQHADVNREVGTVSVLHLACQSGNWETISLLLEHGATVPGATPDELMSYFTSTAERKRLATLIAEHPSRPRPPRECPCWSGKAISDCHGKEPQPYPLHFICICGTGKTYDRCCSRKTPVIEEWNDELQSIIHGFDVQSDKKIPESMRHLMQTLNFRSKQTAELQALLGISKPGNRRTLLSTQQGQISADITPLVHERLLSNGRVDPAFAYALSRSNYLPKPCGRNRSRHIFEQNQARWNGLVDLYIAEGNDPRSKLEIEQAAKIGTWGGALIRVCEGVGCKKSESKDMVLKYCSKCKISVYCSPDCQQSAWKLHKVVCCSEDQREQALPSQVILQQESREKLLRDLREYRKQVPPSAISSMIQHLKSNKNQGTE